MTNMNRSASRKRVLARSVSRCWPRLECLDDRIAPAALHWLGNAGADGLLWNVPANWQENLVPVSGDNLIFDTTTPGFAATPNGFSPSNNIAGLTNLTIAIDDDSSIGDFHLSGNANALAAGGIASNVSNGAGATQSMNAFMPATTTVAVRLVLKR